MHGSRPGIDCIFSFPYLVLLVKFTICFLPLPHLLQWVMLANIIRGWGTWGCSVKDILRHVSYQKLLKFHIHHL